MDWLPPPPPPLLLAVEASPATLVFQKAKGTLPSGDRRWVLQLRRGGKTLASWPAVSGTPGPSIGSSLVAWQRRAATGGQLQRRPAGALGWLLVDRSQPSLLHNPQRPRDSHLPAGQRLHLSAQQGRHRRSGHVDQQGRGSAAAGAELIAPARCRSAVCSDLRLVGCAAPIHPVHGQP
jgi:hypothetical protein